MVKVDLASQTVVATIPLHGGNSKPQDVKLDPTGRVFYVADMIRGGVYTMTATFTVTGFIPTGAGAHGLYVSRDSKVLYVTNRNAGTISLIDFAANAVTRTWRFPAAVHPTWAESRPTARCCGCRADTTASSMRSTPTTGAFFTRSVSGRRHTVCACIRSRAVTRSATPACSGSSVRLNASAVWVVLVVLGAGCSSGGGPASSATSTATGPKATTTAPQTTVVGPTSTSGASARAQPQRFEAALPIKIQEAAAVNADGHLYVLGGYDSARNSSSAVFVLNGSTWQRGPVLPVAVNHPGAAAIGGDVYVAGGFTPNGATNRAFVLAAGSGAWREIPSMHTARGALSLVAAGGRLYAIGGRDRSAQIAVTETYQPGGTAWSAISAMPAPRNHLAGYLDGALICAAGGRTPGFERGDRLP